MATIGSNLALARMIAELFDSHKIMNVREAVAPLHPAEFSGNITFTATPVNAGDVLVAAHQFAIADRLTMKVGDSARLQVYTDLSFAEYQQIAGANNRAIG